MNTRQQREPLHNGFKGCKAGDVPPHVRCGQLVMDAVNVGLAAMHKAPAKELKESVLGFVQKYGFLGFMTVLPTTADFITYESVYLPKTIS